MSRGYSSASWQNVHTFSLRMNTAYLSHSILCQLQSTFGSYFCTIPAQVGSAKYCRQSRFTSAFTKLLRIQVCLILENDLSQTIRNPYEGSVVDEGLRQLNCSFVLPLMSEWPGTQRKSNVFFFTKAFMTITQFTTILMFERLRSVRDESTVFQAFFRFVFAQASHDFFLSIDIGPSLVCS